MQEEKEWQLPSQRAVAREVSTMIGPAGEAIVE